MSEPIKPALTPEEWAEALNDYGGDIRVPPYPPDEKEEFYDSPRRLAARCLYGQPFGFTREDVVRIRRAAIIGTTAGFPQERAAQLHDLADRIEALLPPEKEGA